jgi:hypothetical protein
VPDHVHILASGSINLSTIFAAGVVNESAIGTAAVTQLKIKSSASVDADRSITSDHIKNNAVIERIINDSAVTKAKLASDSVVKAKVHTAVAGARGLLQRNGYWWWCNYVRNNCSSWNS